MSGSRASTEVLTSPSPSPPPLNALKNKPSTSKAAALDDSSELSELTEDEGEGSRGASTHSSTPHEANGSSTRKRGRIVPTPMWEWAYKSAPRKVPVSARDASRQGSTTPPPPSNTNALEDEEMDDSEREDDSKPPIHPPGSDDADKGGESDTSTEGDPDADDPGEDEEEEEEDIEEDEPSSSRIPDNTAETNESPSKSVEKTREASADLTDVDDDEVESEREAELDPESEGESEAEEDAELIVADDPAADPPLKDTIDTAAPVVPAAPAGSSIMAGQQLIKTPTPSPSPSPEPEELPTVKEAQVLKTDAAPGFEPEADVDNADNVETVDADVDVEPEVEVEAEETEADFQPAHRAEALDVLATIELKFALVREVLYVEKMEDLAKEEAMILQGIHPEMIHLQAELQVRHDRRLDLAARKRKHEDDHVTLMRKFEEEAIWSWWKFKKDELQSDMFAEANRKRRKLEREKRVLERPPTVRRIPPPPTVVADAPPLTTKELVRYSATGSQLSPRRRRRSTQRSAKPRSYPTLNVLSLAEVQNDLQQFSIRRPQGYGPQFGNDIGSGGVISLGPVHDAFTEHNALGIIPGQQAFGQGLPQFPPPPSTQQRPYPPHMNRSLPPPPPSHHQLMNAPPIGVLHHGASRSIQGPGQPHVHGGPPPGSAYGPSRPPRSPSPPPSSGFDRLGVNGSMSQHSGMSGPGQHGWSAPGPSKVNGWNKEPRRVPSGGSKEVHQFDMRDMRGERDLRADKKSRELRDGERDWYENGVARDGEDFPRAHGLSSHHHSGSQPHRHTLQHQSLHGIPHHHHVVHRHPGSHHHHDVPRSGAPGRRHEHAGADHDHRSRRLPPDADYHPNSRPNASPHWKPEDGELSRDHSRSNLVGPSSSAMGSLPPPPSSDRLPSTPFVMTPSQAMQSYPPQPGPGSMRREPWDDGRPPPPYAEGHPPYLQEPGPSRHGHMSRLPSPPPPNTRNGLHSPRRVAPPASPPFLPHNQRRSPRHNPHPSNPSPRIQASSLKSTRPISPVPAKILPSPLYNSGPPTTGPGTPGMSAGSSRMGTPGLAGPGTRPDGLPHPNGHATISLFPPPTHAPPLTGPGGQTHMPSGNPDFLAAPKVIPLGNGP